MRVPLYKPNKGQSARVEYRAIDSAGNPYLAFSLMLAAGLKGIEEGYELPPEAEDNVWALTDAERRALGYEPLPASLDHALRSWRSRELVAETLGEQVFNYVLLNKRHEWEDYRRQVTPFELERNLPASDRLRAARGGRRESAPQRAGRVLARGELARLGFADPARAERLLADRALAGLLDPLDESSSPTGCPARRLARGPAAGSGSAERWSRLMESLGPAPARATRAGAGAQAAGAPDRRAAAPRTGP